MLVVNETRLIFRHLQTRVVSLLRAVWASRSKSRYNDTLNWGSCCRSLSRAYGPDFILCMENCWLSIMRRPVCRKCLSVRCLFRLYVFVYVAPLCATLRYFEQNSVTFYSDIYVTSSELTACCHDWHATSVTCVMPAHIPVRSSPTCPHETFPPAPHWFCLEINLFFIFCFLTLFASFLLPFGAMCMFDILLSSCTTFYVMLREAEQDESNTLIMNNAWGWWLRLRYPTRSARSDRSWN